MKKKWLGLSLAAALVSLLAGVAYAQMGWGQQMGPGMMGGYPCQGMMGWGGQMGPGMMGPGMGSAGAVQITEEKAKEVAQHYADQYLKGFSVDKVLPFTGMSGMTMYSVELKGPKDELRLLHVNPWGNVMPFGGPWRRTG
jgi:hypothetical protein